jgi:hypothetical protein
MVQEVESAKEMMAKTYGDLAHGAVRVQVVDSA